MNEKIAPVNVCSTFSWRAYWRQFYRICGLPATAAADILKHWLNSMFKKIRSRAVTKKELSIINTWRNVYKLLNFKKPNKFCEVVRFILAKLNQTHILLAHWYISACLPEPKILGLLAGSTPIHEKGGPVVARGWWGYIWNKRWEQRACQFIIHNLICIKKPQQRCTELIKHC